MTAILIAALSFVVGAITGGVALLVFAAWATRDIEEIEREYAAEMDWKNGEPSVTRGEVLRYAIAYALRHSRKIVFGLKEGLTAGERLAVADHVVAQLKERGDPWRLNDDAKLAPPPTM
jgi:hypothetical protein